MEEAFIVIIDGVAYWLYPETDLLKPIDYKYC